MAEQADARDLKSRGTNIPYRFDPGFRHHCNFLNIAEWSSLVARRAHNPKVAWFKSRLRNQKQKQSIGLLFSFLERCLPLRACDVAFGSDVHCVSDVTPDGVVGKHHITATIGSDITMSEANNITAARRNITLYKLLKIWYNIIKSEVLLWQNRNSAKCNGFFR